MVGLFRSSYYYRSAKSRLKKLMTTWQHGSSESSTIYLMLFITRLPVEWGRITRVLYLETVPTQGLVSSAQARYLAACGNDVLSSGLSSQRTLNY